ncbi:MAG TPA: winged helix-turn-helix domain-containing protein [Erythrobacter sp.]|nr:winged helix-turn-helix domain-containing protein [Erythrobacter sp.]
MISRFIEVGDVTLDLFHRDGRVEDCWLHLHPREFELLWRLAQSPGERLSRQQLLAEVWRIEQDPGTNSLAVHVARLRSKLDQFGLGNMLVTHREGGYLLDAPPGPSTFRFHRVGSASQSR